MHYLIIGLIILVILFYQLRIYFDTKKRLETYYTVFPTDVKKEYLVGENGKIQDKQFVESINEQIRRQRSLIDEVDSSQTAYIIGRKERIKALKKQLEHNDPNPTHKVWNRILSSINRYLERNKGSVSDFHLIKDIVDRNCDAEEEAIQTQVPMPLYFGLMGTMAGIIVGVGYLWLSGGLRAILNTSPVMTNTATNGITALLGGVALAMICSIVGIFLTTVGSSKLKDAKIIVEEHKHDFLSWMQAELLPKLNNDIADVLSKVTSNLTRFNDTFSENAEKLHYALNEVNHATDGQAQLLSSIEKLKISRIASANIDVYDKLKNCTDEIGLISEQLNSSRAYLQEVRKLNEKLDDSEQRTRAIEDMAAFFKEERGNIVSMQSVLNQSIGEIQTKLREAIEHLKETSVQQVTELVAHTTEQRQRLQAAIDEQEKVLGRKTEELNRLVSNLSSVERMVQTLESSTRKQNQAMATLSNDIRELAAQKTNGAVTVRRERLPRWAKILIIVGGSIVCAYCLLSMVIWIISLINTI